MFGSTVGLWVFLPLFPDHPGSSGMGFSHLGLKLHQFLVGHSHKFCAIIAPAHLAVRTDYRLKVLWLGWWWVPLLALPGYKKFWYWKCRGRRIESLKPPWDTLWDPFLQKRKHWIIYFFFCMLINFRHSNFDLVWLKIYVCKLMCYYSFSFKWLSGSWKVYDYSAFTCFGLHMNEK